VELLEDYGFEPHLVHPLQCKAIASARLKNEVDAAILAQLLRADLLPEAWIAPPAVRQLRALLRHRAQLVRLRTLLQNRIHAVLADRGHDRPAGCWSGPGREWLASLELPAVSAEVVSDALALIDALESVTGRLDAEVRSHARSDPRVTILTQLPGVGPFTALVLLAEIGDITQFASARKLASWAGLTRTVSGSDRTVRHGHIPGRARSGSGGSCARPRRRPSTPKGLPPVRRQLPEHRPAPRHQDRHHLDRPQAAHPRLPSAHRRRQRRCAQLAGRVASPGRARVTA
jgi:transposase